MVSRRSPLGRQLAVVSVFILAITSALAVTGPPAAAADLAPAGVPTALAGSPTQTSLILVTGDRVLLDRLGDGRQAITIQPADRGGADPGFHTVDEDGQVYVIPFDAAGLVPEVLDRELFNVTKLAAAGYHDGVPVITRYRSASAYRSAAAATTGPATTGQVRPAGVAASTTLPSIQAVAGTVGPGGTWWRAVRVGAGAAGSAPAGLAAAGPLAGVEKVWLDEPVRPALDESVPLVGAPLAWDAGFDGTGVTVAVLDTGVDSEHPDLAGRVVAEANFSESDTARDRHGHGTHVAGTVGGSGAASGGAFTGTAPGVSLMNGKVLPDDGLGFMSDVIAGMEWAASQGADVVNLSLGAPPTDGTDPASLALNRLTAQHGTLFVVAAGNRGSRDGTIDSPGAADAALTVGSVSKAEFLAFSSGRGPRLGDFAIKPDLTAPGILITSARAEGSAIGTPVGDHYQVLSGTSMATPHVAGAAAILLQAHPELAPAELKAALASTAVPRDIYDVYQQGGGRLDVPAALSRPVLAAPFPIDLGYFRYPQEDVSPVRAQVSYTNRTDAPVTLDLDFAVASRDGAVPSDAMLSVTPDQLTVEPRAVGQATVTLDVTAGEHGLYGGFLLAEQAGELVTRTPVGFYHEPEHYDLTIEAIARDGQPATAPSSVDVMNAADRNVFRQFNIDLSDGSATVRVPPGTYSVFGVAFSGEPEATRDWTMVGDPEVEVSGPTTATLDARAAERITVDTPAHDTEPVDTWSLDYRRFDADGGWVNHRYTMPVSAFPDGMYAVPTGPFSLGQLEFTSRSRYGSPDGAPEPVHYDLVYFEPGGIPADLHYLAEVAELATVANRFHSDTAGQTGGEIRHVWPPGVALSSAEVVPLALPSERVEYLVPGVLRYQQSIFQQGAELGRVHEPITEYAAGEQREQSWWQGPRRPGLREGGPFDISVPATRRDDTLRFPLMEWVDTQPGHYSLGDDSDTTAFRLFQDGELVTDVRPPATGVIVDPDPATFRVEFEVARDAPWWTTSVQTRTAWTFASQHTPPATTDVLPLVLVDYEVDLDLQNTAPAPHQSRRPPTIEILARHQAGAPDLPIAGARLWTSYDDGQTWRRNPVRDLGDGRFRVWLDRRDPGPAGGHVSLRVEAWDVDGNRLEQEIIRAWRVPAR